MKDEVVIVTGGTSGMGKYMAQKFANEGARVVITGRNQERLDQAKEDIQGGQNLSVKTVMMDVRSTEDVERMVKETVEEYGAIHHLVNNAAGNFIAPIEKLSYNGWNAVIDIVLNGTFLLQPCGWKALDR